MKSWCQGRLFAERQIFRRPHRLAERNARWQQFSSRLVARDAGQSNSVRTMTWAHALEPAGISETKVPLLSHEAWHSGLHFQVAITHYEMPRYQDRLVLLNCWGYPYFNKRTEFSFSNIYHAPPVLLLKDHYRSWGFKRTYKLPSISIHAVFKKGDQGIDFDIPRQHKNTCGKAGRLVHKRCLIIHL